MSVLGQFAGEALDIVGGFVAAITVPFACGTVIGLGLAATSVRFVIENR